MSSLDLILLQPDLPPTGRLSSAHRSRSVLPKGRTSRSPRASEECPSRDFPRIPLPAAGAGGAGGRKEKRGQELTEHRARRQVMSANSPRGARAAELEAKCTRAEETVRPQFLTAVCSSGCKSNGEYQPRVPFIFSLRGAPHPAYSTAVRLLLGGRTRNRPLV